VSIILTERKAPAGQIRPAENSARCRVQGGRVAYIHKRGRVGGRIKGLTPVGESNDLKEELAKEGPPKLSFHYSGEETLSVEKS